MILDLTWTGWFKVRNMSQVVGLPYLRLDVTVGSFVNAVEKYLTRRDASDAALIFHTEEGTEPLKHRILILVCHSRMTRSTDIFQY